MLSYHIPDRNIVCYGQRDGEKIKGCTCRITKVSPTMCSSVSNLVSIQCLYSVLLP